MKEDLGLKAGCVHDSLCIQVYMSRLVGLSETRAEGAPPACLLWTVGEPKHQRNFYPLQAGDQLPDDCIHTEEVMCLAYCTVETLFVPLISVMSNNINLIM